MSPASSEDGRRRAPQDHPRPPGAEAVSALLDQAATMTAGVVPLPAMTAAELCVLGAMSRSLIDASAWSWWISAPAARRTALWEMAWQFLSYRGLVTLTAPGLTERARIGPSASLIAAGRIRPAFIVLCREDGNGEPGRRRMFGIAEQDRGLRAVLVEDAGTRNLGWAGPAYQYGLASPAAACHGLSRWAAPPGPAPGRPARRLPRLVDIYLPGAGPRLPAHQIAVYPDGRGLHVKRETSGPPVTRPVACDEDFLACLLAGILTGASR